MRVTGLFILLALVATLAFGLVASADENTLVSLNVKDADVRDVIEMIAKSADLNYVLAPEVRGRIGSLVLIDVPARVAIEQVLNQLGLQYTLEGGIFSIFKPKEESLTAASLREVIAMSVPQDQQIARPIMITPKEPLPVLGATGVGFLEEYQTENYVTEKVPMYFADAIDIAYMFGGDVIETRMMDYAGGGGGGSYGNNDDNNSNRNNNDNNNRNSNNNNNSSSW